MATGGRAREQEAGRGSCVACSEDLMSSVLMRVSPETAANCGLACKALYAISQMPVAALVLGAEMEPSDVPLAAVTSLTVTAVTYGPQAVFDKLTQLLPRMRRLQALKMQEDALWNEDHVVGVLRACSGLRELTSLRLHNARMRTVGAAELARVLAHLSNLRCVTLQTNHLGDRGLRTVSHALARLPRLRWLNVSYNQLTPEAFPTLRGLCTSRLQGLVIGHNRLGDNVSALTDLLADVTALTKLSIGHTVKVRTGFGALSSTLARVRALRELSLSTRDAAPGSLSADLFARLGRLTALQILSLRGHQLTHQCAVCLTNALKTLTELRALDMDDTDLDGEAFSELAPAIGKLSKLTWLTLGSRRLRSLPREGAWHQALDGLTRLRYLYIKALPGAWWGATKGLSSLTYLFMDVLQRGPVDESATHAPALESALATLSNLQEFRFKCRDLAAHAAVAHATRGLADARSVTRLTVTSSHITESPSWAVTRGALDALSQLLDLRVLLPARSSSQDVEALSQAMAKLTGLSRVRLTGWFELSDAADLCWALSGMTGLRSLLLEARLPYRGVITELSDSLSGLVRLTGLQLSCTDSRRIPVANVSPHIDVSTLSLAQQAFPKLPDESSQWLGSALRQLRAMQVLKMTCADIAAVGWGLPGMPHLTSLDLAGSTELTEPLAGLLAQGLSAAPQLGSLRLDGVCVGAAGMSVLAEGLAHATGLSSLCWAPASSAAMTGEAVQALAPALLCMPLLQVLVCTVEEDALAKIMLDVVLEGATRMVQWDVTYARKAP